MADNPRNNARKTRGRPFAQGNPGRPKGARHKATLAAEALLDGEAEALTRKAIERAKEGDPVALRLCLERIVPPRKDRPVSFSMIKMAGVNDALAAMNAIMQAVACGDLTPREAAEVANLVETYIRAFEANEVEERLSALEERAREKGESQL